MMDRMTVPRLLRLCANAMLAEYTRKERVELFDDCLKAAVALEEFFKTDELERIGHGHETDKLRAEIERLVEERGMARTYNGDLLAQNIKLLTENERLTAEVVRLEGSVDTLMAEVNTLMTEIEGLKKENEGLVKDRERLKVSLWQMNGGGLVERLRKIALEDANEIEQLKTALNVERKEATAEIERLKADNANLRCDRLALSDSFARLQAAARAFDADLSDYCDGPPRDALRRAYETNEADLEKARQKLENQ